MPSAVTDLSNLRLWQHCLRAHGDELAIQSTALTGATVSVQQPLACHPTARDTHSPQNSKRHTGMYLLLSDDFRNKSGLGDRGFQVIWRSRRGLAHSRQRCSQTENLKWEPAQRRGGYTSRLFASAPGGNRPEL